MAAKALQALGAPPPTEGWAPCSDRSLEREDPLPGTGGYGARWFLVEIDGAWGDHAFLQSRLDPELARRLVRRIEGAGMRPLAIRRTGRRADERRAQSWFRWAVVDSRPGLESVRWDVVHDPWELLEVPLDGSVGVESREPLICVCTHARHDQCCAVKGRPAVRALAAAYPKQTWECSHLGGDRFAATMILFPHGLYYGRVPADQAPEIVRKHRARLVDPRYLRGRSSLSAVTQAAQAIARGELSDNRIDAFPMLSEERSGDEWTVRLEHYGVPITVRLRETVSEPLLSTCSAVRPARVRRFEPVGLG